MSAIPSSYSRDESRHLGDFGQRVARIGFIAGGVLVALAVFAKIAGFGDIDNARFMKSWLFGFMLVAAISLGALFFVLIQHMTRAGWSVSVRRVAEAFAGNLIWLWVLFLPLILLAVTGHGDLLYSWMDPAKRATDPLYAHKAPYLNAGFWAFRAVLYLGIWAALSWFYFTNSTRQDASGNAALTHRMQRLAPVGIILFALTATFAAVDWMMALEAHWFSTMFGVYFFAICCGAFFSVAPIVFWLLQRRGLLLGDVTLEHFQDLGKLLFAFGVVFHAYIGFSQFMLIWYASIPEELGWFIVRTSGPWRPLMYAIAIGHFAVPFVLLVTKHTKRVPWLLASIAAWMLVMTMVDLYVLVMPEVDNDALYAAADLPSFKADVEAGAIGVGWAPNILDLLLPLGFLALLVGATAWRMRETALVPIADPRLGEARRFENM